MIVLIEFIPIFELMIDDLLSEKGFLDMINEKLKE